MRRAGQSRCGAMGLIALFSLGALSSAFSEEPIVWNADRQEVKADIGGWPLPRVLKSLSSATGWQIYVDPEARTAVSTRFQKLKPDEALRRLLGDLNYALLRPTNGPARLFVYRTSLQDATLLIEPTLGKRKADRRIPNELIVSMKPGANETIDELAKRLGAKVLGRLDDLHAYRLQFESEEAAQQARNQLSDDHEVASVDNNYTIDRPERLESLAMSSAPSFNLNPKAVPNSDQLVVALIDTPVYGEGSPAKDFLLKGLSLAGETPASPSELTHGTAMAETILQAIAASAGNAGGKAPRILPIDVYGMSENTTTFDIARGIEAALEKNPAVYNLSLGGESDSEFLHQVIAELRKQDKIVFVGSAGNTPTTTDTFPAAWPEVLSVAAGTSRGGLAPYSNRSDSVDVIAQGSSIVHFGDQAYIATGTSTAAANVSGAIVAYMLANPGTTAAQAAAVIQKQSPFPSTPK